VFAVNGFLRLEYYLKMKKKDFGQFDMLLKLITYDRTKYF